MGNSVTQRDHESSGGGLPQGGVYCAGNLVVDVLVRPLESMPEWGSTTWVESIEQHLGGNGAATAYTLGKLGARVRLAGAVGDDEFGQYVLQRLRSAGVDLSEVRVEGGVQTAGTVGVINRQGERLFLHLRGASCTVIPERLSFADARASGCAYFHLASLFHMPKMRQAGAELLAQARQAGLVTSFDTVWDASGRWMDDFAGLCPWIDLLFVNQQEARMLAGSDEPAEVARAFLARGVRRVVLKMAESGCAVLAEGEQFTMPAFEVAMVDSTGAGDCFCGGFLAALGRGFSLRLAADFANAVGALAVGQMGGTEGVKTFAETLEWMAGAKRRDAVAVGGGADGGRG
ncbi:MAG TPA: carbohydrate kinase family protein [Bryobacterales bacterium]|nr:carbohydrate kinase family protein [Bryobacterales bacterium]